MSKKYITIPNTKGGSYIEYRIVGHNSIGAPFIASPERAAAELQHFNDTYLKYGNVHTLLSRTVEISEWS